MLLFQRAPARRDLLLLAGLILLIGFRPLLGQVVPPDRTDADDPAASMGYAILCDPEECVTSPGLPPIGQLSLISDCLTGPHSWASYECRCADIAADHRVDLRDYALFQNHPMPICERVASIEQNSGLGFCPSPGSLLAANVVKAFDGTTVLAGSLVVEGDPGTDECMPESWPDCFVDTPFESVSLTQEQVTLLMAQLDAIPSRPDRCDCCIDPCIIVELSFQDRYVNDYCYFFFEPSDYHDSVREVFEFLNDIVRK